MLFKKKIWKLVVMGIGFLFAAFGIALIACSIVVAIRITSKVAAIDKMLLGYGIAFGVIILILGSVGWLIGSKESYILTMIVLVPLIVVYYYCRCDLCSTLHSLGDCPHNSKYLANLP